MLENDLRNKDVEELAKAFSKLRTKQECLEFLRDVCTIQEIKTMADRLQIAKRIAKKQPYRKISKETGASTTTVTRISHWYHHGPGGYKSVLKRLK